MHARTNFSKKKYHSSRDSPPPPPRTYPRRPQPLERYRSWLDYLPLEVTESILKRLSFIEILASAQKVCLLWRKICKNPSMWGALNMGHLWYFSDSWEFMMPYDIEKMCRRAVDLSCGQLVGIEVGTFCNGNLLKYISERSRGLKYLRVRISFSRISYNVWREVAKNVPLLEELELSYLTSGLYRRSYGTEKVLKAFGRSCLNLKSLKLRSEVSRASRRHCNLSAFAIAKNMPGLVSIVLDGHSLTDDGVMAILGGCPRLQSLEIRGRGCSEQIKDMRLHYCSSDEGFHDRMFMADSGYCGFLSAAPTLASSLKTMALNLIAWLRLNECLEYLGLD